MRIVSSEDVSPEGEVLYLCISCLCFGTMQGIVPRGVQQQLRHTGMCCHNLLDGESAVVPPTLLQCCCILSAFEKVLCSLKLPPRYPPGSLA